MTPSLLLLGIHIRKRRLAHAQTLLPSVIVSLPQLPPNIHIHIHIPRNTITALSHPRSIPTITRQHPRTNLIQQRPDTWRSRTYQTNITFHTTPNIHIGGLPRRVFGFQDSGEDDHADCGGGDGEAAEADDGVESEFWAWTQLEFVDYGEDDED